LKAYYEKRAPQYEEIYSRLERRSDLAELESALLHLVAGKHVLELACGTGFWTRRIATVAGSLLATDLSKDLALSAASSCASGTVRWVTMDAFDPVVSHETTVIVAGFLFSHIPTEQVRNVLEKWSESAPDGTLLVLFDNLYVAGSNTPIATADAAGNTYQLRELPDGSSHLILKNFVDARSLEAQLGTVADRISVRGFEYYWLASCHLHRR
jgi:demethylmenaquinone methyltransferase/2-methoxy-6-polyprenyl-1,4-benzoquinol methylase